MSEPGQPDAGVDPRELFESHLGEIERIVGWIARRACLVGDDAEEFRSWVHVKLMENDFRVLRSHSGRSTLGTYLAVVVQNLARDFKSKRWGRWRPSAAAERRGVTAVQLETLLYRDGFSLSEATEMLRRHHGVRMSAGEIGALAAELPQRSRPATEGGEAVETAPAADRADEAALRAEARARLAEARRALSDALAELDSEDRLILRMHYERGLTIAAIAAALGLVQRRLYTRREASLRSLRAGLEKRGLEPALTLEALRWSDREGRGLDFRDSGPSNPNERGSDEE